MALLERGRARQGVLRRSREGAGARRRAEHADALGQRAARRGAPGAQPRRSRTGPAAIRGITASTSTSSRTSEFRDAGRPATRTSTGIKGPMIVRTAAAAPATRGRGDRRGGRRDGHRRRAARRCDEARGRAETPDVSSMPKRRPRGEGRRRHDRIARRRWSSSSSPPARRASTSTATRASAR